MVLDGSCTVVARQERPETWHGRRREDWGLARPARLDADHWHCPHTALSDHPDGRCVFHASAAEFETLNVEVDESGRFERAVAAAGEGGRPSVGFVGATLDRLDATVDAGGVGVVPLCAGLYPFGGFRPAAAAAPTTVSTVGGWLTAFPDSRYFSTLTFTTLGFGDFQPAGWGRTLVTLETSFGATLLALLVFVLGRWAAR